MKKKFLALITAAAMVISLAGCGGTSSSSGGEQSEGENGENPDTTTIAFSTWTGYAPFFVARDAGIFEKNGVDVTLTIMESASDKKAAMAAGQIDGVAETVDTSTMSLASGQDHVQVLALDTSYGGDGVVAKKENTSITDLKGKQVALDTSGGASIFYFNYLLKENNMTMEDVDVQNMSSGDAGAAFVGGNVDAAVTWEPWLTKAKETDFGTVLADSSTAPGVIVDTLNFSSEFIEKYPTTVQKIVDSWYEAVDYYNNNTDESVDMMAKGFSMDADDFKDTLSTIKYYGKEENVDYFQNGKINEISQMAMDLWYDMGLIDNKADVNNGINGSFVAD